MIRKNIRRNSGYLRRHSSIISGIHPLYLSRDQEREGYEDSEESSSDNEVLERVSSPSSTNTESRGSFQKNKRYLSQEKVPEVVESRGMLLDPDGPWYYRWMLLVTCMVLYNIIVIILRAAFKETREQEVPYWTFYVLDSLADFIFIVDVIIQSHVTYYKDGCLVFDKQKIFRKYTKNIRFKIDVISILPIHSISLVVWGAARFFYASLPTINTIDGGIVMPVLRFPRLTKTKLLPRFFDVTDSRTTHPNGVRAVKLSLYLCMVIHWIACLYYILSEYEGLHSNEWVYAGNETDSFSTKYIRCVYWSLLILTTIGERPPPQTDLEYVFTGMTFVIGVFLFAAVVGNVGDVISNMNASRQEFQARMDQIKFYMHHRNIPKSLQDRVKRWSEYNWSRNQCMDESQMLQMLPQKLQMEMAIQVHLETLKKVKMFEECEEGLLRELVLKLKSQMFLPGDYICHIGDIGKEMYIINHGKIEILVPNGKNGTRTVVAKLRAGNYFGEISLLQLEHGHNRRTADVRSVGYSELLCLSRKDLINALVEYPVAKKILETQAKERMRQITGLGNKKTDSVSEDVVDSPLESNTPTSLVPLSMCVVDNNDRERLLVRKNSRKNHDTVDDKIAQLEKQIKELELKIRNILSAVEKKRSVSLRLERKQSSLEDSLSETDVFPYTVSSPVKNQEIAQDTSLNTLDAVKIERQLKDLSYSETFVVNDSNELNEMNSKQILPAPTTHRRAPPNWSTILKHSNMKLRQNSNHKWFSGKKPQSSLSCDLKDQTRQSSGYSSDLDSTSRAKSMSAFKSGRFNSTESERTNQDVDLSDNENYTYSLTNMNKQSNKCKETDV